MGDKVSYSRNNQIIYDIATNRSIRQPRVKIEWIDDRGLVRSEITKDIMNGSLTARRVNGVRRNLNITLTNKDLSYIPKQNEKIWIDSYLKLYVGYYENGKEYFIPQGVYSFKNPVVNSGNMDKTVTINCVDLFGKIDGTNGTGRIEADIIFPLNTPIKQMLEDTFQRCKDKKMLPENIEIVVHPSLNDKKFPYPMEFAIGNSYGGILKKVADTFNYQIYFNRNGLLAVEPQVNQIKRGHVHRFEKGDKNYIKGTIQTQFENFYNKVIVIGERPSGVPIYAVAEDKNPLSTTSINKVGERVAPIIKDDGIYSQQLGQDRADYELLKNLQTTWTGSIETMSIPTLDVGDIIIVNDMDVGLDNERGIVDNISFSLEGNMNIDFSKTKSLDEIKL